MSTAEPLSAFAAYNAGKKDTKKTNGTTGRSAANKSKSRTSGARNKGAKGANTSVKAKARPPPKGKATVATTKPAAKTQSAIKPAAKPKGPKTSKKDAPVKDGNIKDSEIDQLVEELLADPQKKLTKEQEKKKQNLEDYLVRQLEKDGDNEDQGPGDQDDFSSECDSDAFSDEYTLNETGSYSEEYSDEEEEEEGEEEDFDSNASGSETDETDAAAAESAQNYILSKATTSNGTTRKRKSQEGSSTTNKTSKSEASASNGVIESKKTKKSGVTKSTARKSLPSVKTEKAGGHKQRRSAVGTESSKDSTAKVCPRFPTTYPPGNPVKLEPLSPPTNVVKLNSINEGKRVFRWLLNPVPVEEFFAKYWESKCCLIKRQQSNYFSKLISFEAIDQMLLLNHVEFTKNIDITSYKNGVRETLNPEGRAMPPVVWNSYGDGCSIRLLNPQIFLPGLYTLSATLQEFFHCLVGANAYLTPPNSQGFAPHYDDIEAFVLQIEGRKRWKLYKPRNSTEILARFSSENFSQEEIGKPVLEEVLEPGDLLYFPRGTIHQACTEPGHHSLHITLSVYQKQSFADLFERMMPLMLQKAIAANIDMRRGLPLHTWQHAGIAFSESATKERAELQKKVSQLMQKCIRDLPLNELLDAAVDQLAKRFQHEALPPEVLPSERLRTVFGSRNRTNEAGECVCDYDIELCTNVRLLRANILRLVSEEQKLRIYYYLDNSKEYCEYEPNFIEIDAQEAGSVEVLIRSYPEYVGVAQLPLPSDEQKLTLVTALWERGLLMMEKPFK